MPFKGRQLGTADEEKQSTVIAVVNSHVKRIQCPADQFALERRKIVDKAEKDKTGRFWKGLKKVLGNGKIADFVAIVSLFEEKHVP